MSEKWLHHDIPLGTKVSFKNGGQVHVVDSYQTLLGPCPADCALDHDCYEEPYIVVREQRWTAYPLKDLEHIFDNPRGFGRKPTEAEKTPVEWRKPVQAGEPVCSDVASAAK